MGQRRGVALVRVSKAKGRADLISPELQRFAIEDYCTRNQITVTSWVEVLDESASQARSQWWRTLDAVVEQIEQRRYDVVLVWKFNRAARNRRRWAVAIDRIEVAGGTLESATEGIDATTSTGRLARGMLAELAAWESDVKSEQWKEAQSRRIRMGLPSDGRPRVGYIYNGRGYEPDETLGPILAEVYRRYTAGQSARSLAGWLNDQQITTRGGMGWDGGKLIRTLDTGFAAGLLSSGQQSTLAWVEGAQEPLITRAEWEAYRLRRITSRVEPPASRAPKFALSGMLRCDLCGLTLNHRPRPNEPPGTVWMCQGRAYGPCTGTTAYGPRVLRELRAWVLERAAPKEADLRHHLKQRAGRDLSTERKVVAQAETKLLVLARKNLSGFYDDATYLTLRGEVERKRDEAQKRLDEQPGSRPSSAALLSVAEIWDSAEPAELRQALKLVLKHVLVVKGEGVGSQHRNVYVPVPRGTVSL
jgi:site-specific DNA recombinase